MITEDAAEAARNLARAEVFKLMANEEAAAKSFEALAARSDDELDVMAQLIGIPERQYPVYRAMVRGEENEYFLKIVELAGVLQSGDVVLVTGRKITSKALVAAQIPFYSKVRSSHVAMVHADFICIDANPGVGVKQRTIAEVLGDVEDSWRIIRFNAVTEENRDLMLARGAYYLQQPYSIRPTRGAPSKFSYCSELVSKVYRESKVRCVKVPQGILINPCHFDKLADKGEACQDITESVRPFVPFLKEYKEMMAMQAHAMIAGLKLNRHRDKQRKDFLAAARAQARAGKLSHETLVKMAQVIQGIDEKMNFRFWDSTPRD